MPLVSSKVHMDIEFKGGASDLIRPRRVVIPPLSGIVSANRTSASIAIYSYTDLFLSWRKRTMNRDDKGGSAGHHR
jgi:hypothetical protein